MRCWPDQWVTFTQNDKQVPAIAAPKADRAFDSTRLRQMELGHPHPVPWPAAAAFYLQDKAESGRSSPCTDAK